MSPLIQKLASKMGQGRSHFSAFTPLPPLEGSSRSTDLFRLVGCDVRDLKGVIEGQVSRNMRGRLAGLAARQNIDTKYGIFCRESDGGDMFAPPANRP
jgi:hypothetical protein